MTRSDSARDRPAVRSARRIWAGLVAIGVGALLTTWWAWNRPTGLTAPAPGVPRMPPFSRVPSSNGTLIIRVDHAALTAYCRALQLPDPPDSSATDAATYELICHRLQGVGPQPSADSVGKLGEIYNGNGFADRAQACYEHAVRLDPRGARWWHLLGIVQVESGDSAAAVESFRKAVQFDPANAAAHARLGRLLSAQEALEEAERHFQRWLELRPTDTNAHYELGKLAFERGQAEPAKGHLLDAVRHDPKNQSAHYLLARVLAKLGDEAAAAEHFRTADQLPNNSATPLRDPIRDEMYAASQSTAALQEHMLQHWQAGRREEAYQIALQIVGRRPGDFVMWRNAGLLARETNRPVEAEQHLRRSVEVNPGYILGHTTLAEVLRDLKRGDEALLAVDHALRIEPDDGTARLVRGSLLIDAKRYAEALPELERGLVALPDHGNGHAMRGFALWALGRLDEAELALRRAEQLMPQSEWVKQRLLELEALKQQGAPP